MMVDLCPKSEQKKLFTAEVIRSTPILQAQGRSEGVCQKPKAFHRKGRRGRKGRKIKEAGYKLGIERGLRFSLKSTPIWDDLG